MSTTSNSRNSLNVSRRLAGRLVAAAGAAVFFGSGARLPAQAPNAPLPARGTAVANERPRALPDLARKPVKLSNLAVREFDREADKEIAERLPEETARALDQPVLVEVKLAEPIVRTSAASWPVVVLNGVKIEDTQFAVDSEGRFVRDRLVAVVPDRKLVKDANEVAVVWIGREQQTRTKEPLTFRKEDVAKKKPAN